MAYRGSTFATENNISMAQISIAQTDSKESILSRLNRVISKVKETVSGNKGDRDVSLGEYLDSLSEFTEPLADTLGLSQIQTLILAAALEKCSRHRSDMSDIAGMLGFSYIRLLSFNDDIEDLRRRGYIKVDQNKNVQIPKDVINALSKNIPYTRPATTGLSTIAVMRRFKEVFSDIDDEIIEDAEAMESMDTLVRDNPQTSFSRVCGELGILKADRDERQLFYFLASLYYNDSDDMVNWGQVDDAFSGEDTADLIRYDAVGGNLGLMTSGAVEFTSDEGIRTKDYLHITDSVKARLFADAGGIRKRRQPIAGAVECKSIGPKELFYEKHEAEQIATLERMLTDEGYASVCRALREKGMRTGLTVLMHGAPGTGKTSCVYELARRTGRDIIVADVSKIKDCYVGETEKNIKALFDSYRRNISEDGRPKILLFNEADAIFGVRKEGATDAVDKMEGSLQNIILQEMEDLDGILIATTNLTGSLDKAFMRRFLYKIEFSRPSAACKARIWKSMLPELTDAQTRELAESYPSFTGGNIENICRKKTIQGIVSGKEPGFGEIRDFCNDENIGGRKSARKIGY